MKYFIALPLLFAMVLLCSYMVGSILLQWRQELRIRQGGVPAQAQVVALQKSTVGLGGHGYRVTYRLLVDTGGGRHAYEREGEVSREEYTHLEVGQPVDAVYHPDTPGDSRL